MIKEKIKTLEEDDPEKNFNIGERYKLWISNISDENKTIFEKIFCDLQYYSEKELRKQLQNLYNSIEKTNDFVDESLILTIESQSSKFNSSIYMTSFLVECNNLANNYCTLSEFKKNNYRPKNIILCDDFIGTGKTIKDFLKKNLDIFKHSHIYLLCIHAIENGLNSIFNCANLNGINIEVITFKKDKKYFESIQDKSLMGKKLNKYKEECERLKIHYPLGNRNIQANVVTYRNTPNNSLGVIWEKTEFNNAIFARNESKIPKCRQMNIEKKGRRIERYINGKHD